MWLRSDLMTYLQGFATLYGLIKHSQLQRQACYLNYAKIATLANIIRLREMTRMLA